MLKSLAILTATFTLLMLAAVGCATPTGSAALRQASDLGTASATDLHSAKNGIGILKSYVSAEGLPLLRQISANIDNGISEQSAEEAAIAQGQKDYAASQASNKMKDGQIYALSHSWGWRLEVFCKWAFWILVALVAIHVGCGIAASVFLFIPALAPVAPVLKIVSNVVNPGAWITWLTSALFAKKAAVKVETATQAVVGDAAVSRIAEVAKAL